jgi:hypothetical protein
MSYLKYVFKGLKPKNFYYLASTSIKDTFNISYRVHPNKVHIKAAMQWLSTAQKQNKDGGVSTLYSLFNGWGPSYVETTGYIISTFFNYAKISKDMLYRKEAIVMADFELGSQLPSGAFAGVRGEDRPVVFNTGQVIFGLCRAYEETKDARYKKAAEKACDWLVLDMDDDGCWRKNTYRNCIHTYNTRTAWSLLRFYKISKNIKYKKAAEKNFEWALSEQLENGWIENNGFYPEQKPLLHTIAYSIRGFLEGGLYLKNKKYLDAAIKASESLLSVQRHDGSLPGRFNKKWKSDVSWSCLTGNSQMSIIWQKLFIATKENKFIEAAKKANAYMKTTQNISSSNAGVRGGIQGAMPIYGWYAPFSYPNWAAKFFADSLMLEDNPEIANKLD